MFREIRTRERITDRDEQKKSEGYKKIKPESDMTYEEAVSFVKSLFE